MHSRHRPTQGSSLRLASPDNLSEKRQPSFLLIPGPRERFLPSLSVVSSPLVTIRMSEQILHWNQKFPLNCDQGPPLSLWPETPGPRIPLFKEMGTNRATLGTNASLMSEPLLLSELRVTLWPLPATHTPGSPTQPILRDPPAWPPSLCLLHVQCLHVCLSLYSVT